MTGDSHTTTNDDDDNIMIANLEEGIHHKPTSSAGEKTTVLHNLKTSSSSHDANDHCQKTKRNNDEATNWKQERRPKALLLLGCCPSTGGDDSESARSCSTYSSSWKTPSTMMISMGRFLFVGFLCLVAAFLGLGAYFLQKNSEENLAKIQFEAIADRAIDSALDTTSRKMLGAVTMASIYSNMFPNANRWPFVYLNGFQHVGQNIKETSRGRGLAFAPIVRPDQAEDFETFAYRHIIPEGEAISSFGKGIFAFDKSLNNTDKRYHDRTGETRSYNSSHNNILVPILQAINPDPTKPTLYMLNYHSIAARGQVMDGIIDCSNQRRAAPSINATTSADDAADVDANLKCGAITDITPPLNQEEPGAVIMLPVYPAGSTDNDTTTTQEVVGFLASSILWSDTLERAFNGKVSGVDVVLHTSASPNVAYTYRVIDGHAKYRGNADMHDPTYDSHRRTAVLTEVVKLSDASPEYYMTIYPSKDFFGVFSTRNPTYALAGAVLIIVFTSLLFFLYDALVSKENQKNQAIIEGRRRFMRYVSHEVRTPLNSVFMGLKLLREELATLFAMNGNDHHDKEEDLPPLLSEEVVEALIKKQEDHLPYSDDDADNQLVIHAKREQTESIVHLSTQILGSASNAIDVLNDLLNYDKIETGQLQLEKGVLDIWSLLEKVVQEFDLPFKAKNIHLVLLLEQQSPSINPTNSKAATKEYVVGDNMKITQVFRNLLSNALKFTPEGGTVTVKPLLKSIIDDNSTTATARDELTLASGEQKVALDRSSILEVEVRDTGAGLSEDQIAKLFRAGVQYNSNKLQAGQGSGLGLFIAKGIMTLHHGDLTAKSAGLGQGTAFTMTIPLYHVPPAYLTSQEQDAQPTSGGACTELVSKQASPEHLRILVVDDAITNRKLLVRLLEKKGHTCEQAEDGVKAVEKARESVQLNEPFDSVLLDYEMPNLNGPGAATEMQKIPGFDSFIVGITGNVLPEDVAYFKKCGANHVLAKPLNIPSLTELWEEHGIKAKNG